MTLGQTHYPRMPMDLRHDPGHRAWGDGLGDGISALREHKIEDISFRDEPRWVRCEDGTYMEAPDNASLERAWDVHRGHVTVHKRVVGDASVEQATDEEVSDFLKRHLTRWVS